MRIPFRSVLPRPPVRGLVLASLSIVLSACGGGQSPTDADATGANVTADPVATGAEAYNQTPEGQEANGLTPVSNRLAGTFRGQVFVDVLNDTEVVTDVQVCAGNLVDAITLTTNQRTLPRRGGSGGTCRSFHLNDNEQIMRVAGTAGEGIETLTITTTQGRVFGPYGGTPRSPAFSMTIPGGPYGRFRGFQGLTGVYPNSQALIVTQLGLVDPATGGTGGGAFIDRMDEDETLKAITTCWRSDAFVQSIQLQTNKGTRALHGGPWPGQSCDTTTLADGEFITEIFGRAGSYVDAVGYRTSSGRRIGPFGGPGGEGFSESVANPARFVGLYGRSGAWLDRIGLLSPTATGDYGASGFRDTLPAGQEIHAIQVCVGVNKLWPDTTLVRSVQAFYNRAQPQALPRHGALPGAGDTCHRIELHPGEAVQEMSGRLGAAIDSLRLRTTEGRSFGPYGGTGGATPFILHNPHPAFLGFAGRATQPGNRDGGMVTAIDFATPDLHETVAPPTTQAGTQGWWGDVASWPLIGLHAALLPDGRLMSYGTDSSGVQGAQFIYDVWNPAQGLGMAAHLTLPNTLATDMFCSSQSLLPNGRLLLAGGDARDKGYNRGIRSVSVFDPSTNALQAGTPLRYARWYASQTVLSNGDILVLGGNDDNGGISITPEVYSPATGTWKALTGAASNDAFTGAYPRAFVTRSTQAGGRAVWVLSTNNSRIYRLEIDGNRGAGQLIDTGVSVGPHAWDRPVAMISDHEVLVQLNDGRTQRVTLPQTNKLTDKPSVAAAGQLSQPRSWSEMVLLPTGDVLAVNGSANGNTYDRVAYHAELWSRQTQTWRTVASQMRPRLYHSAAMLLPDGSVLALGGGAPGPQNELNAQAYHPPYLYNGAAPAKRPTFTVTDGRSGFSHGESIRLSVNDAANVARVNLTKLGSTTHSHNTEQRHLGLSMAVQPVTNTLTVTLPAAAHLAPPGFYLLTVVDKWGVPSTSRIVKLGA